MKWLITFLVFLNLTSTVFADSQSGTVRSIDFWTNNGDLRLRVNKAGVMTDALSLRGTTGAVGIGTTTPSGIFEVRGLSTLWGNAGGTVPAITYDASGNVTLGGGASTLHIATSNGDSVFRVSSSAPGSGGAASLELTPTGTQPAIIKNNSANTLQIRTSANATGATMSSTGIFTFFANAGTIQAISYNATGNVTLGSTAAAGTTPHDVTSGGDTVFRITSGSAAGAAALQFEATGAQPAIIKNNNTTQPLQFRNFNNNITATEDSTGIFSFFASSGAIRAISYGSTGGVLLGATNSSGVHIATSGADTIFRISSSGGATSLQLEPTGTNPAIIRNIGNTQSIQIRNFANSINGTISDAGLWTLPSLNVSGAGSTGGNVPHACATVSGSLGTLIVFCPANAIAVGGGCSSSATGSQYYVNAPIISGTTPQGWTCNSGSTSAITTTAICCTY